MTDRPSRRILPRLLKAATPENSHLHPCTNPVGDATLWAPAPSLNQISPERSFPIVLIRPPSPTVNAQRDATKSAES